MIQIILLVIGILGFAKGRIDVSSRRELRGSGMYAVATLFCLPLPLSFLARAVVSVASEARSGAVDENLVSVAGLAATGVPLVVGFVIAAVMSKPKLPRGHPGPQGFIVIPRKPASAAPVEVSQNKTT